MKVLDPIAAIRKSHLKSFEGSGEHLERLRTITTMDMATIKTVTRNTTLTAVMMAVILVEPEEPVSVDTLAETGPCMLIDGVSVLTETSYA